MRLPPTVHTVSVALHPAFAMHGTPQFLPMIDTAIRRAVRAANREEGPERPQPRLLLSPTLEEFEAYLAAVPSGATVAVDVETPYEQPTVLTMVGIAADTGSAAVVPWLPWFAEPLRRFLARGDIVKVGHNLAYDIKALAANGIEIAWPHADTIQAGALLWPPFAEAKDREWITLPLCVTRVLDGIPFWKESEGPQTRALYRTWFPSVPEALHPFLYCALDCILTLRLWFAEKELLHRTGMWRLFEEIVAPAAPVLVKMEMIGMPLDGGVQGGFRTEAEGRRDTLTFEIQHEVAPLWEKRLERIQAETDRLEADKEAVMSALPATPCPDHPDYVGLTPRRACQPCASVYAQEAPRRAERKRLTSEAAEGRSLLQRLGRAFRPASNDDWRWLLFDRTTGYALDPVAATGKRHLPKVDDESVARLARKYPSIKPLHSRAELQQTLYALNGVLAIEPDQAGRAHFAYSIHRTETGRLASGDDDTDPDKIRASKGGNAQNVPKRYRRMFTASAPGRTLVQFDWSQIEARVTAWLARETLMLDSFRRGDDIHSLNAAALYGCTPDQARKHTVRFGGQIVPAREAAKRATHGWDYGMGDKKTADTFGLTVAEAALLRAAYFAAWPRLAAWQAEVEAEVMRTRRLVNPFGRALQFHGFSKNRKTGVLVFNDREEALAFLPQSTVGDMCKAVLPGAETTGTAHGADLLTTTHDSYLLDVPATQAPALIGAVLPLLEREWPELGDLPGFGRFSCPADVAMGWNWAKKHVCDAACPSVPCPMFNPDGLGEVR